MRFDFNVRIHISEPVAGGVHFWPSDVARSMQQLPVQVGDIDRVMIDEAERPHPRGGQIHRRRRAKSAGADDQHPRSAQALLPLFPDFRKGYLSRIALAFCT